MSPVQSVNHVAGSSKATAARDDVVAQLDANVHRQVTLGLRLPANELTPKPS